MRKCDRCGVINQSVVRSPLPLEGVPRRACGCIFLCLECRIIIVAELNA